MALIGFDARSIYGPIPGGIGNYLRHLIQWLLEASPHRLRLYRDSFGTQAPFSSHERLSELCLAERLPRLHTWEQLALPRQAKRDQLDLLHCPANYMPFFQGCPTVVTLHDLILTRMDDGETRDILFYWRQIMPHCFRRAVRVITDSEASRRDIVQLLRVPEERVRVIHLGIDDFFHRLPEDSALEAAAKAGLPAEFIFMVGASSPHKNVDRAVDAFIAFKRRSPSAAKLLTNIKSKPHRARIEAKLARHRLQDQALLLDYVTPELLRLLYNRATIFLFPSLMEGFGFPVVEAMACGAPVAVSNASCLPEIAGDAATLFDPLSEDDMARAMTRLLGDATLRGQMQARGYARARQFSWTATAEKTLAVYSEVLGGG